MSRDFADHLVAQWAATRPDLDPEPMAIVVRLMRLGALLEERLTAVLREHDLTVWEFDVLATLRRNGPEGLPPKQLLRELLLSSGAMTHRIDRLEEAGLVKRSADPADRRGTIVRLTSAGVRRVDPAVRDRFEDARQVVALLERGEARALRAALRKLALALQPSPW
ncbi:MAG: MarR family transcriptional regulator [Vicinamibacterales bacterium]|nr:MarR family transcriptional regulator [Vicinamibacterales bacterium]